MANFSKAHLRETVTLANGKTVNRPACPRGSSDACTFVLDTFLAFVKHTPDQGCAECKRRAARLSPGVA